MLQYTPYRGRVHVTLRSTIPIRFACVERRKTPVFVRFGVQKHVEFQVGLYCNLPPSAACEKIPGIVSGDRDAVRLVSGDRNTVRLVSGDRDAVRLDKTIKS